MCIQYKKEIENFQPDKLSRLGTNAEAGTSTAKLNIPTFETTGVSEYDFIHFNYDMSTSLLITPSAKSKDAAHEAIDLAALVQKRLRGPLCRQIRERINDGQHLTL